MPGPWRLASRNAYPYFTVSKCGKSHNGASGSLPVSPRDDYCCLIIGGIKRCHLTLFSKLKHAARGPCPILILCTLNSVDRSLHCCYRSFINSCSIPCAVTRLNLWRLCTSASDIVVNAANPCHETVDHEYLSGNETSSESATIVRRRLYPSLSYPPL